MNNLKIIASFLLRRWWLTQQRLFSTIGFGLLLPVILHMAINLPLKNIVVRTVRNIPYETWVFPGMLMIIATLTLFPLLFRDMFDLRIHKNVLIPITLTPISKHHIIWGILTTAVTESMAFVLIGMIVFSILIMQSFLFVDYLAMFLYILVYNILMGNLFISISLITRRVSILIMIMLSILVFLLFGSGFLVEFEFYPVTLGMILQYLPTGMLLQGLRLMIFSRIFNWVTLLIPLVIIIFWTIINGELLRKKLNQ